MHRNKSRFSNNMKIAVNISLVPEMPDTPHFHPENLEELIHSASSLGYDGIEIFPKSAKTFPVKQVKKLLVDCGMELCVIGSGAGKVLYNYTFTDPNPSIRKKAVEYVSSLIEVASEFGAMMMVGSMQGNISGRVPKEDAILWLSECISRLEEVSKRNGIVLVFEPINRYETNLINTLKQGCDLIRSISRVSNNLKIAADMFHMNIEEVDPAEAICEAKDFIAHYHFVDSNRLAPGMGHTDFKSIAGALAETRYEGYLSIECFTGNDPEQAMKKTMDTYNKYFKIKSL